MKITKPVTVAISAMAVLIVAAIAVGSWLILREGDEEVRGTCGSSTYQLSVESEDGGLEVNFELLSAAPGEMWDVVVQQDASILLEGQRTTDEDAELDVDVATDEIGDNDFVVTATPPGGEACTARLTYG